jgi:hypothetical protein
MSLGGERISAARTRIPTGGSVNTRTIAILALILIIIVILIWVL